MNRLPAEFDLSPLVGQHLRQVCLDQYQIQLHFDGCHIQGAGKVSLELNGETIELFRDTWNTSSGLEHLVGTPVTSWDRRSPNHFVLTFASGAGLLFETVERALEDFTVSLANGVYWVL